MLAFFMPSTPLSLSVFIDGGYLFKVFERYYPGYRYSCKRLIRRLSENFQLVKVHYVNSINHRNPTTKQKQEKFYHGYLRDQLNWNTVILPLQWPGGEAKQKGTDAALTLLLHDCAVREEYGTAVLLAADSDFVPAVERVKQLGKIVRNAYFSKRPSWHLQQACNGTPIKLDTVDFAYKDGDPANLLALASLTPIRQP